MSKKFIKQYAKLDEKASPLFIEPKAYVFVGYSSNRMTISNMPTHNSIKKFDDTFQTNDSTGKNTGKHGKSVDEEG